MTSKEIELMNDIKNSIRALELHNQNHINNVHKQIDEMNEKIDKKHLPVFMEKDILQATQTAITKSITEALSGYNSPMQKLVNSVIESHQNDLREILNDSFTQVINTEDFKKSVVNAFTHRIAKNLVSTNDSLFDKVTSDLKQDPVFKSKMMIAVANIVDEHIAK